MLNAVLAAHFQNIEKASQVRLAIGGWIDQRIAYARLRGEMGDIMEAAVIEQGFHRLHIGEVTLDEGEALMLSKLREARFFQAWIIIIIEIVKARDAIALVEQAICEVKANETRSTCDEDGMIMHVSHRVCFSL